MTLDQFRLSKGWNYKQLAEFLGHEQRVVRRWCLPFGSAEFRRPHDTTRFSIVTKTGGAVGLADWFPAETPA